MIRREDGRLVVEGAITLVNVTALLAEGLGMIDRDCVQIDLAEVTEADSSAVALLIEWARAARRAGRRIVYLNLDNSLRSLVSLYDVGELLPQRH
ncbi:MAG: STAS domain-containing protein [Betaproteobacteria bacterium]